MEIDKGLVRKHFDRHAFEYDRYASVQAHMAVRLGQLIVRYAEPPGVRRILELGSGTGGLTGELLREYANAELTAVDISAAMLAMLGERLGAAASGRVRAVHGDAEADGVWTQLAWGCEAGPFDLMASSAAFQWFNEPQATLARCLAHLRPGGVLAFATFGPQTFHELTSAFRSAEQELGLAHRPHGQTFCTEAQWRSFFPSSLTLWQEEKRIERFASVRDFLQSVQKVGAGNASRVADDSGGRLSGRRLLAAMQERYAADFGDASGIPATYHICYGVYCKPLLR
ncbi:methyltransferase domain-containing protein [Paenibacillus athensensis]|uniref:Malonyl-[acyl-carrier protein] O-methyltransferase n=1 Tax=Paenibacillus athensensis TaxID=1967502 RepID=A0A4Y8PVD6_9BACL|nr:methyltransferase domain-containing protein [Paenibacillus athensensis]MCD1258775.1 methyltransferase domain-containing protein [Paenibacillus athensensis]